MTMSQIAVERQTGEDQEASPLSCSTASNTLPSKEGLEVPPNSSQISSTTHRKCHPQRPERYLQTNMTVFDQSVSHRQDKWTTKQQTSDQTSSVNHIPHREIRDDSAILQRG